MASPIHAQVTNVTNDTSTPVEGAGHNYIGILNETVNPATGSVSLRIQVPVPKSRAITIPFSFAYDSNSVRHLVPGGYQRNFFLSHRARDILRQPDSVSSIKDVLVVIVLNQNVVDAVNDRFEILVANDTA